ncbi:hypothetical protein NPX13_g8096 [Xylaria arbuscula]|uniref:Uncharacterized protein n=1 Tax=Xylaria arbuscula TaxID=114810 RepID=A0A9W8N9F5_9PEZI|nr:hypothetical protein NPX13_g8096 [Xylaria arbuscula]
MTRQPKQAGVGRHGEKDTAKVRAGSTRQGDVVDGDLRVTGKLESDMAPEAPKMRLWKGPSSPGEDRSHGQGYSLIPADDGETDYGLHRAVQHSANTVPATSQHGETLMLLDLSHLVPTNHRPALDSSWPCLLF